MSEISDFQSNPPPVPNRKPSVHEMAILALPWSHTKCANLLNARKEYGLKKYGTFLQSGNGRDVRVDFLEELGDALAYAFQGVVESDNVEQADQYRKIFFALADLVENFA